MYKYSSFFSSNQNLFMSGVSIHIMFITWNFFKVNFVILFILWFIFLVVQVLFMSSVGSFFCWIVIHFNQNFRKSHLISILPSSVFYLPGEKNEQRILTNSTCDWLYGYIYWYLNYLLAWFTLRKSTAIIHPVRSSSLSLIRSMVQRTQIFHLIRAAIQHIFCIRSV